jgi:hypothetical protein
MPTPLPTPSGRFHQPAGVPAGEEVTVPLRQTPDAVSGSNDPTMMATPVRTASIPAAAGVTGATAAPSTTLPVNEPARARKWPAIALTAAAVIIVLAAGVGALMLLQGSQPAELPAPPPPPVLAAEPAPPAAVPGPEAPPNPAASALLPSTTTSPPPQTPAPGANAPVDAARGAARTSTPPANPAAADPPPAVETLPPATVPPPPVTGEAAAPAASDPLLTFPDVKLYSVTNGKNTSDRDALLSFAGGQLLVMPKSGGAPLVTLPYGTITRATYVKARDPKWDRALPGPPEGVDVGSFLRQGRHWLVLQGADHYQILRLEDNNVTHILSAIEARTGVKVDRPKSD